MNKWKEGWMKKWMNKLKDVRMNEWMNECIPANIFYEADLEFVYSFSLSLTGVTPKDVKVSRCQDVKIKGNVSEFM